MSFYAPEQRCPRCRSLVIQGAARCEYCGLALGGMGGAPASRSGPQPSRQPNDFEGYGSSPGGDRFGSQGMSGPPSRPGEQFAPRGSGPWGSDAGTPFRQPSSGQQRPDAFGDYSGMSDRAGNAGNMPTRYQRPTPDQSQPPAGWGSHAGGQRPSGGYQPTTSGWESPSSFQGGRGDASRTSAGFYQGEATPLGSQPFRGASGQMYQPGGQTWQQPFAGAPPTYPGARPAYDDPFVSYQQPLEPPGPPRRNLRPGLIVLVVLVLLAALGGGAAFLLLRSSPVITFTSKYQVGSTPAGATATTLHFTGSQFASNVAVSFLLDGQSEPGHQTFQSDAKGGLQGDLNVTADWPLGQHTLTAKDASGNTTLQGKTVAVVAQGEADTPGPNGAPANDTPSFTIDLTVHAHDKTTDQKRSYPYTLVVTGQPDPAGGKVCSPEVDTGPQTVKGTSNGVKFTETFTVACSGTYKGGKITYTQTISDDKIVFSNKVTCTATAPYVNQELDGSFTSATDISGTISSGTPTFKCTNGNTVTVDGTDGTWVGSISA